MAGSVNKVILVGNLGQDPEIRNFDNGGKIAQFSLATSEYYKDQKTGEKITKTEWHRVVIQRPGLVDTAAQFLRKGMSIFLEGRIRTRSYQTKENETRYITEIVADEFQMLTPKQGDSAEHAHDTLHAGLASVPAVEMSGDDLPF
jgi:single-strand DNA-binding protein